MTAPAPQFPDSWDDTAKAALAGFQQLMAIPDAITMRNVFLSLPIAPVADDVKITQVKILRVATKLELKVDGHVDAEWQELKTLKEDVSKLPVCLYWHGGGYIFGTKEAFRPTTTILARNGIRILSINYRMGPEVNHPAAITDAYSTYKYALSQGIKASQMVFAGDSAGGGLTYGLALYLRDEGEELPAGLAPITPWIDLALRSPSVNLGEEFTACMLVHTDNVHAMKLMSEAYVKDRKVVEQDPYISPILASVDTSKPLPPQYITTGTHDRLLAEDLVLALNRSKAEKVQFELYQDQIHDFQIMTFLPAAQKALVRQAQFMKDVTSGKKIETSFTHYNPKGEKDKEVSEGDLKKRLRELVERYKKVDSEASVDVYEKALA